MQHVFSWIAIKAGLGIGARFFLAQWRWFFFAALGILILIISLKIHGAFKDRDALIEAKQGTLAMLTVDLNNALIEKQSAQQTLDRMIAEKIRVEELAKDLVAEQVVIRAEAEAQKAIFRKHDFKAAVQGKPGLIQTRANMATQERFDELASVFNQ